MPTLSFTTAKSTVSIVLKGTGSITINWGNGNSNNYTLPAGEFPASINYGSSATRTITITFNTITLLNCRDNQLTALNVSGCTTLQDLRCFNNNLTSLNVSGLANLTHLYANSNKLTSLAYSGCTKLQLLSCYENNLTSLNVTGFTNLTHLHCDKNSLASLNVSGCTKLVYLDCKNNSLSGTALNTMFNSLPTVAAGSSGGLFIVGNPGATSSGGCNTAIATNKRWMVDFNSAAAAPASNSLTLNQSVATVKVSNSGTLTVTSGNSSGQALSWASSNNAIVTVDSRGNYVGKGRGVADIIVKTADKLKEGSCKVYVYQEIVTSLGRGIDILDSDAVISDFIKSNNPVIDINMLNAVGQIKQDSDPKTDYEISIKESVLDVVNDFNQKSNVAYTGAFTASVDVNFLWLQSGVGNSEYNTA